MMSTISIHNYLSNLGYAPEEISNNLCEKTFTHSISIRDLSINIHYVFVKTEQEIYERHRSFWNKNSETVFIAVAEEKSYLINAKAKPDQHSPLKKGICIYTFHYGINSKGYEDIDIEKITKEYINSTYFFEFVRKNQKKKQEVDKDLLLNLLELRQDLLKNNNEQVVHLLILRCLFVKYLEDRGIFEKKFLVKKLQSNKAKNLLNAFDEVRKINGDVFGGIRLSEKEITQKYLQHLTRFFEYDYRSGQGTLFPYEFDNIPIQLISHVYEAFLKTDTKKGKGIYYTPAFVVNFMLSQTLKKLPKNNKTITILDPAVGSATFLVESFRIIQEASDKKLSFEDKKNILENQLFGIDVDESALQIAAFSLYLALLETESSDFIRKKIETSSSILPPLIGKTLHKANSLTKNPFPNRTFDLVISNPPWGSVPTDNEMGHKMERQAIENKNGEFAEYGSVADYERSQAFLMRANLWSNENTVCGLIVKNSVFLNEQSKTFRETFLNTYQIDTFYELSHYNKILFKKKVIGEIQGQKVETGASEPCAVIIFRKAIKPARPFKYIAPKLTKFAEYYECLQFSEQDRFEKFQSEFSENDLLWRVLVNGDIEILNLISKTLLQKNLLVESRVGFQPSKIEEKYGTPDLKRIIEPNDIRQYLLSNNEKFFNWNQKVRRKTELKVFNDARLIFPVRPLKKDNLKIRGTYLENEALHKDNIIAVKLKTNTGGLIKNTKAYIGLLNSELFGFYLYQISSQWGKGEGKRESIRNVDTKKLPFKQMDDMMEKKFLKYIKNIEENHSVALNKEKINNLVYDYYNLLDYEREILREFYQVRVDRANEKLSKVNKVDIERYVETFKSTFSHILSPENTFKASYHISPNVGAIVCFSIVKKEGAESLHENPNLQILNFVKSKQLQEAETYKILNEEKVKIYDEEQFFLIKSNLFKDWTVRQAMKDAREEISLLLSHLPDVNE